MAQRTSTIGVDLPAMSDDPSIPAEPSATGELLLVGTPIGNLADLSPRARQVLAEADRIACEDTRTTRTLLAAHGISTPTTALHAHNERSAGEQLLQRMRQGARIALVSDAGMPAISDPGALLVQAAHREGIRVSVIPGPNAAACAYAASGFLHDRFLFAGFLPASGAARRKAIAAFGVSCPVVLHEAPHRVLETIADLLSTFGPECEIVFARELTKKFEEVARMKLADAGDWLVAHPHRQSGEFVLVLGPREPAESGEGADADRVLGILMQELSVSAAARVAARITGAPRKALYTRALELDQASIKESGAGNEEPPG